ncbi:hypothetical protein HZC53_04525 [Candidatus Uhrbacteria bacterium]|nr:hypothetical protein [Candidatus Uhrbacteria bacterium]
MAKSLSEQLAEKGFLNPEQTADVEKEIARSKATVVFWRNYRPCMSHHWYHPFPDYTFEDDFDYPWVSSGDIVDETVFLLTKEEYDALDFTDDLTYARLEKKLESYELYAAIQDGIERK